jgi:hypothetical protein
VIFKNPRSFLVAVGLKISEVSWFYTLTVFIVVYATSQLNLPRALLLNVIFIAAVWVIKGRQSMSAAAAASIESSHSGPFDPC